MLEQSWEQKKFLILTYTWVSFVVGFGWRNSFLHVLVNLEIGKRKERIPSVRMYCSQRTAFLMLKQALEGCRPPSRRDIPVHHGRAMLRSVTSH